MSLYDAATDLYFSDPHMAHTASYQPKAGGVALSCRIILKSRDDVEDVGSVRIVREVHLLDVRKSEISKPVQGEVFTVGSDHFKVIAAPQIKDQARQIWTCEVERYA